MYISEIYIDLCLYVLCNGTFKWKRRSYFNIAINTEMDWMNLLNIFINSLSYSQRICNKMPF